MIEPAATQLAMDPTGPKQPMLPTDSTDQMLPTDKIDPVDPMERIDPVDLIDRSERSEPPTRLVAGRMVRSGAEGCVVKDVVVRRPVAQRARATHSAPRAIARRGSRRGPRVPNRFWSPGTTSEAPFE